MTDHRLIEALDILIQKRRVSKKILPGGHIIYVRSAQDTDA